MSTSHTTDLVIVRRPAGRPRKVPLGTGARFCCDLSADERAALELLAARHGATWADVVRSLVLAAAQAVGSNADQPT